MSQNLVEPDMSQVCRSVMIGGQRTSIRMERQFWKGLDEIKREEGLSMQDVLQLALAKTAETNRTAAIKTWVLSYYMGSRFVH